MGDSQYCSNETPSWLGDDTIGSIFPDAHGLDFLEADLGLFPCTDPAIFQGQAPGQDSAPQAPTVEAPTIESKVDREIVELLRCATPTTKESILHLLRRSTRVSGDSGSPSGQPSTDPAVQQLLDPLIQQNTTYYGKDGGHFSAQGGDCIMLSPPAHASFEPGDELNENAPTQSSNHQDFPGSRPRPTTLPACSNEEVLATRQMAKPLHFSAPGPSQTVYKPKNGLGSSSMSSQSRLYVCGCGWSFKTNADLTRHKNYACSQTKAQDKIQFTCLLDVSAPTCHRPCSESSHQNKCFATCQHRPPHYESYESGPRSYHARPDKMRDHLIKKHGWPNFSQGDIPQSWKWPLKWIISTYDRVGPAWACALCEKPLGTWEEDWRLINRHCEECPKGADAREARFGRHNGPRLNLQLAKGTMGSNLRDEDLESGDYSDTNELF